MTLENYLLKICKHSDGRCDQGRICGRQRRESRPESWVITLKGGKEEVNPTNEIKTKKLEMEKGGRKLCQKKEKKKNGTK